MNTVAELDFNHKATGEWHSMRTNVWGDLKKQTLFALKRLLETSMAIEVQDLVGSPCGRHNPQRKTYRNGSYGRRLLTSFGPICDVRVPRLRSGHLKTLPRYLRRLEDIDQMVLEMFLAGVSTRRVQEVLEPILGPKAMSAGTVSKITRVIDRSVQAFHQRPLKDRYVYLILDGIYLRAKSPLRSKRRCLLVAYGITQEGIREFIDFRIASQGESENAWNSFLSYLFMRGLEGKNLRLIVLDGNKGLGNACAIVFPHARRQRCWAHKLRNVANTLPRKLQAPCINHARQIYSAQNPQEALGHFRDWKKVWNPIAPRAVACLEQDLEDLLPFLDMPKALRIKLRTTNIIERCFREVRRRTRPICCFTNIHSLDRIVFAIFYRQNKLWEKNPLSEITQKY